MKAWIFVDMAVVLAGCDKPLVSQCLDACGKRGVAKFTAYGINNAMVCECGPGDDAPPQDGGVR